MPFQSLYTKCHPDLCYIPPKATYRCYIETAPRRISIKITLDKSLIDAAGLKAGERVAVRGNRRAGNITISGNPKAGDLSPQLIDNGDGDIVLMFMHRIDLPVKQGEVDLHNPIINQAKNFILLHITD